MSASAYGQGIEKYSQLDYAELYCLKFERTVVQLIGTFLKEMEDSPYPVDEYLNIPWCSPGRISGEVKSPLMHIIAEAPISRAEFLSGFWKYYEKKRRQPELFTKAINAKNTKGQTFLDYMEWLRLHGRNIENEQQPSIRQIINFSCSHGGVYSFYPKNKCE